MWTYSITENDIKLRDLEFDSGKGGEPVQIIQLTDLHLSWVSEEDKLDPVIASSYEHRVWSKDGRFWEKVKKCLDFAESYDLTVVTGDIFDYYTEETARRTRELIFDRYKNLIACVGNHEPARKMQGLIDEVEPIEVRVKCLEDKWCNDIYYCSRIVGEKVMAIALDNSTMNRFHDCQIEPLRKDIELARERGYIVFIFCHDPMSTGNKKYERLDTLDRGDCYNRNFYNNAVQINALSEGASGEVYRMITSNADVIKGFFCGHYHSDFYTEIDATTPDGEKTVIPQYVMKGTVYEKGNALRITVK